MACPGLVQYFIKKKKKKKKTCLTSADLSVLKQYLYFRFHLVHNVPSFSLKLLGIEKKKKKRHLAGFSLTYHLSNAAMEARMIGEWQLEIHGITLSLDPSHSRMGLEKHSQTS